MNRTRFLFLMAAVVLASSCVAVGGSIGFIGLICPHIARRLVGVAHKRYLPVTALLGGVLLVAADYTARVIIAPDEMLVGLIVSLIARRISCTSSCAAGADGTMESLEKEGWNPWNFQPGI